MAVLYNENDPFAAQWLRELEKAGHIASGTISEKSIEDIMPSELDEYAQVHLFAGIGVWSYALRLAGWPDTEPVWTGSCPCQPFSAAGKRKGITDERHLWPAFFHLVRIKQPVVILGEQVASKDGLAWCDLVFNDLENTGYTCGAVDTCASGFGAPHIRQRLYWVAYKGGGRSTDRLAHPKPEGLQGQPEPERNAQRRQKQTGRASDSGDVIGRLDNSSGPGRAFTGRNEVPSGKQETDDIIRAGENNGIRMGANGGAVPTNGFWKNPDWLWCRDKKWRPVESGLAPLVDGTSASMGRLRGYGNALVAYQAKAFIEAVMDILGMK